MIKVGERLEDIMGFKSTKEKKETQAMLLKVIQESGKTPEEIMELLKQW